jgi:hypothetical protein
MSIVQEIQALMDLLNIRNAIVQFSEMPPPDTYVLITPIGDDFDLFSDDEPTVDISSARISLFTKGHYEATARKIVNQLLDSNFSVTNRTFVNREVDTGYNHYAIDCEKIYFL